jgi:NhaP-type Na+/H+ or K+/H+ antiporter
MGVLGESIIRWVNIDGDLILYVFLPALIFGEAMNLNWYQVKGGFMQALLLAGPGVIIGAFSMGMICYCIMPFGWSWNLSMIFGSVI